MKRDIRAQLLAMDTANMTMEEICEALGYPQDAVRTAIYNAKRRGIVIEYKHVGCGRRAKHKPKPEPEPKPEPPKVVRREGCKGCVHWRSAAWGCPHSAKVCHYLIDTGHRRGCVAGEGCLRYEEESTKEAEP